MVLRIVRSHHERMDGGGFPDGLSGDRIPRGGPHRRGGGCVRRDDHEPRLPAPPDPDRGLRRAAPLRRHALRSRGRGRVHRARSATSPRSRSAAERHSPSMSDTLMISVSGMRGHVGTDLTPELVARHAAALGAWARLGAATGGEPSCRRARPGRADQRADVRPRRGGRSHVGGGGRRSTSASCRRRRCSWRWSTTTPAPA